MSKSQREKGAQFERDVARTLTDELGTAVKRNLGQARDSGDDITVGPFRIECKRRASLSVYSFIEQAEKCDGTPVVVMRGDGKRPLVMMYLDDAIPLIREGL